VAEDLLERFLAAFNSIDATMRAALAAERDATFTRVLRGYSEHRRGFRHKHALERLAQLRNVLVHDTVNAGEHLATPSPWTVALVERIRDDVTNPRRVLAAFQRKVASATTTDSVASLLRRIHECDYSQFPVFSGSGFVGLATENGITRWMARHITGPLSLVDLEDHCVSDIVACEEARTNHLFVDRSMLVDDLLDRFRRNPSLEAGLITEKGRNDSALLGIATRWDILREEPSPT
jgi:predicted transcriptional regulator